MAKQPPVKPEPRCNTCSSWEAVDASEGFCHRYPPHPAVPAPANESSAAVCQSPRTFAAWWCREWEAKPT